MDDGAVAGRAGEGALVDELVDEGVDGVAGEVGEDPVGAEGVVPVVEDALGLGAGEDLDEVLGAEASAARGVILESGDAGDDLLGDGLGVVGFLEFAEADVAGAAPLGALGGDSPPTAMRRIWLSSSSWALTKSGSGGP